MTGIAREALAVMRSSADFITECQYPRLMGRWLHRILNKREGDAVVIILWRNK